MNKKELSIIMVNWKVADLILKNLASIFKYSENFFYEVIVVDNNSGDNIEALLKENFSDELASGKLVFIQSGANLGFAKGNNLGLWLSIGEHVVFMNPDMELFENTYWKMLNYYKSLDSEKRGLLGCKLLYPDKTIQPTVKNHPHFFDQSLVLLKMHHFLFKYWPLKKYFALDFDYEKNQEVHQLMGAMIFAENKFIKEDLKGWSEDFWIWWEDVDLCKRVEDMGKKNHYYSEAAVFHYEGKSFGQELSLKKQTWFIKSMMIYFSKHLPWYLYWQLLILGILIPISYLFTICIQLLKLKSKGQGEIIKNK